MTGGAGGVSLRAAGEEEAESGKGGVAGIIPSVVTTPGVALT